MGRIELLQQLPKGGIVAEVGVRNGCHAALILEACQPERLHLIDKWPKQKTMQGVRRRFAPLIRDGQVVVKRQDSVAALSQYPSRFFDWVYVDAGHRKADCLADLRAASLCCKDIIAGHDYIDTPQWRNGVIAAVEEFCEVDGWVKVYWPDEANEAVDNSGFILQRQPI